jgi:hydrogenase expression/formation protein HypE
MSHQLPEMGKISAQVFDELIFPHLGAKSNLVLTPPQHGVDVGIVDLGNGKVMALTSDPVFIVPEYGFERAAWFAIHILVSDAVTSGLKPSFLCIDLNLPLSLSKDDLSTIWLIIDRECKNMGINIISGHTARYQGCNYPMVGGATVICIGDKDRHVTPKMAQIGDKIILTKGAAIEASGIFAVAFEKKIKQEFGEEFSQRAEKIFWQMSVVEDALTAASVGTGEKGVTSMHDATECGVWGGLYEVAKASKVGMRIEKDKIIVLEEVDKICTKFGMDPYSSISEGTLIVTCKEEKVELVIQRLIQKSIPSSVIGEITEERKGIVLIEKGKEWKLEHPQIDPFWEVFAKALGNNH